MLTRTENGDTATNPVTQTPGDRAATATPTATRTEARAATAPAPAGQARARRVNRSRMDGPATDDLYKRRSESDDQADGSGNADDPTFWRDVQQEAAMLEAKRPAARSRDALRPLAPYIDRKIIGQIERACSARDRADT